MLCENVNKKKQWERVERRTCPSVPVAAPLVADVKVTCMT